MINQIIVSPIVHIFEIVSLFAAELEKPKIGKSGKRLKGQKILWEKSKMLFTSIFSFPHNAFKRPLFQGHYKVRTAW